MKKELWINGIWILGVLLIITCGFLSEKYKREGLFGDEEEITANIIHDYEYEVGLKICRYYEHAINDLYLYSNWCMKADDYATEKHVAYKIGDSQKNIYWDGTLEKENGVHTYSYSASLWKDEFKVTQGYQVWIQCLEKEPLKVYNPSVWKFFRYKNWLSYGVNVGLALLAFGVILSISLGKKIKSFWVNKVPYEIIVLLDAALVLLVHRWSPYLFERLEVHPFRYVKVEWLLIVVLAAYFVKRVWGNKKWYQNTICYYIYKSDIEVKVLLTEFFFLFLEGYALIVFFPDIGKWFFYLLLIEKIVLYLVIIRIMHVFRNFRKTASEIAKGNLSYQMEKPYRTDSFEEFRENMNAISEGVSSAVEERMKSERMKTELITNVTHDIKTPLTSIINFSDLIMKEKTENPKITEYSEHLYKQSVRMKRLIDNLLEVSKASTGNLQVNMEKCELRVLTGQFVGEYSGILEDKNLELCLRQSENPIPIMADPKLLWRMLENLISNIGKYSLENTRVFLTTEIVENHARLTLMNTSKYPIDVTPENLMERFVRGDVSRHTEGNGLGLAIVKSLADLQNVKVWVDVVGDLFKVFLEFDIAKQEESEKSESV